MEPTVSRLRTLFVRDVMTRKVVGVSANATMEEAAAKLRSHGLGAAPVTDEQGKCVGILTAVDYLRRDAAQQQEDQAAKRRQHAGAHPVYIEESNDRLVSGHMSAAVQTISPDDTLLEAARRMCLAHIHHLPVLDHRGMAMGLLSSMDLVAAMLNAAEEDQAS